jgi:hypothetical protein
MIEVSAIHLHEAAHAIAAKAMSRRVSYVWASERQGTCMCAPPDAPFAAMVLLAAGEAAGMVKVPYRVHGKPPPPAPEACKPSDPTASAVATFWLEVEKLSDAPAMSDRDRVAAKLDEMVKAGRIKRRDDFEWRWWQRAKSAARKLLSRHHHTLSSIAGSLARTGALSEAEVEALWESRWERHSFTGGDRART